MKDLGTLKAAIIFLAVTAGGCGMQGGTSSVGILSPATRQEAAPLVAPDAHKNLAGIYNGSVEWSKGSKTYSGTLETRLRFHGKNILGPFKITVNGQTHGFRLYGRIKTKTAAEALIVFLIYNTKGGYATGTGTIANSTFAGKAQTVAAGNNPGVTLDFSAVKNQ
jgi:hypothetical protein